MGIADEPKALRPENGSNLKQLAERGGYTNVYLTLPEKRGFKPSDHDP